MTTRLYYTDPYLTAFEATVLSCRTSEGRHEVVLDRTAFYPTSGGQPFDLGTLGDALVRDVVDLDDGTIAHVMDRPLAAGSTVAGQVEWRRRFDHMQQHTGQHVLSAAYDRLFGVRTESFHLGAASASIDLAREVSPEEIRAAEDDANRVVWEDREVRIRFASAEEAAALPLRKESLRSGPLRLIDIEGYDLSACGGTHVARTGGIGVIATAGWERFRKGTRLEFVCGGRALARFRHWRDAFASTARHLSVQPQELAAAVEKLQAEVRTLQKTLRGQQEALARHEAQALAARGMRAGDRVVIAEVLDGWDAVGLKSLAAAAVAQDAHAVVALFSRAQPATVVVAAAPEAGIDASAVLRELVTRFGGKGGGKRDLAQGGGLMAPHDELIAEARRLLTTP